MTDVKAPPSRRRRAAPTTPDPIELAMEAAPPDVAERVLERHAQLIGWQIASERAGFVLKALTIGAVAAAVGAFGVMAWEASRARGLVVAGFSAPPSYAARGLSGDALAADLTHRIAARVRTTNAVSLTRTDGVRADGGDVVKVEIPQTGVSLGEISRALRGWLGHERRLTAALRDEGDGVASIVLALAGADPVTVRGPAGDIDGLMNAAADAAFAEYDPQNVIIYLGNQGREQEAGAAAERLVRAASTPRDRARAYGFWALTDPDAHRALVKAQLATEADPQLMSGWLEGANATLRLGRDEAYLAYVRRLAAVRTSYQDESVRGRLAPVVALGRWQAGLFLGDYVEPPEMVMAFVGPSATRARVRALLHDGAGAAEQLRFAELEGLPPTAGLEVRWAAAAGAGDWPAALGAAQALTAWAVGDPLPGVPVWFNRLRTVELPTKYRPWLALAMARTGDVAAAQTLAAMGPLDCYLCVRVRGQVAEAAGDRAGADRWFAEAVRQGPSLPFAHLEWGQAKLARGDRAGAVAAFARAHALSPRFADPLEAWGEALAAQGDAAGAAAKYAEAAKIAPKWGRLHLKWGQALARLGQADEARAHFRTAAGLNLSGPDRAELAAQRA